MYVNMTCIYILIKICQYYSAGNVLKLNSRSLLLLRYICDKIKRNEISLLSLRAASNLLERS